MIFSDQGRGRRSRHFILAEEEPFQNGVHNHVALATTTRKKAAADIVAWLRGDPELNDYEHYKARPPADCVLNVAGSRESSSPGLRTRLWRL